MAANIGATFVLIAVAVVVLLQAPASNGNFLYFKPGQEYQYKFTSNTSMKGMDKFSVAAKVGYTNIGESKDNQEIYLRVPELSLVAGDGKASGNVLEDWDMSKWFSFKLSPRGEVTAVYHDPAEDDQKLSVKKGFAALLAARLHDRHETDLVKEHPEGWAYDVKELGHEGHHDATYVAQLDADGNHVFTKTRSSHPLEHSRSNYTKRIEYNRESGLVHRVQIHDDVNAVESTQNRKTVNHNYNPVSCSEHSGKELTKTTGSIEYDNLKLPGMSAMATGHLELLGVSGDAQPPQRPSALDLAETSIHVTKVNNVDKLPGMSAMATGHLELLGVSGDAQPPQRPSALDLAETSIHVTKPKAKLRDVDLAKVLDHVSSNLTCMRWEPAKGSPKLTNCFRMLRNALSLLPDEEVEKLAQTYLPPQPLLQQYARDRVSMLDALSDLDSDFSQRAVADRVLLVERPESTMAERFLLHVAGRDAPPCDYVLSTLESIVFEPERYESLLSAPTTHHRAALALGAVTRKLWDQGGKTRAEEISEKLRNLLGMHEDSATSRQRRSVLSDQELEDEDSRRVVLLEALGNTAMPTCYKHILSHLNMSTSQWVKRAALHALRHYDHDHKYEDTQGLPLNVSSGCASVLNLLGKLLDKVLSGGDGYCNQSFKHCTLYYRSTDEELATLYESAGNTSMATQNESTHKRVKRSSQNQVLNFEVKSPNVDWTKVVGTTDIGASFGVTMKNKLKFNTGLLDTNVEMDMYDEAFARVNLGTLSANREVFQAKLCFKGRAVYDVNMLQEFDPTEMDRLTELYDLLKDNATSAIKDSMTAFRTIVDSGTDLGDTVKTFVDTLNDLPGKVLHLGDNALSGLQTLGELDTEEMPAFVGPLWRLANKIMNFYGDIQNDVIGFYTQVFQSIADIVDSIQDFNSDPKSAINTVNDNTVSIGLQAQAMIEAIEEAKTAAFFLAKTKPYWWNMKQQKDELNVMAQEAETALNDAGTDWVANVGYDELESFSEGRRTLSALRQEVVNSLSNIPTSLISPFSDVADLGDDLQKSFTDLHDLVYDIKQAYEDLRVGVNRAQELVNRVFGPRVHRDFPKEFRVPGGACTGSGLYESSMGHGRGEYPRKGIDLTVAVGQNVSSPFSGYVTRSHDSDTEVVLQVTAGLLRDITIYINNVNPDPTIMYADDEDYQPNHVAAGDILGTVSRSSCENHIHLSMLKESRGYIDPTAYLEPRVPVVPTWTQECDDYKFVYKANTVATGLISGLAGKLNNNTSPARTGATVVNPTAVSSNDNPATSLDRDIVNASTLGYRIRDQGTGANTAAATSGDSSLQKLVSKASVFLSTMNPKNLKVGSLAVFLNSLSLQSSFDRLRNVFQKIQTMLNYQPCLNPYQMPDDQLRNELRVQGKATTGTRAELVERFLARENRKSSPGSLRTTGQ
ncbi:protein jagged-2 [Plakobranchus ocellatus]|uniref:Protein jagged-2 n=1 Tax=Plakobranchus ocellatus TaxID=259542 RepID=A0AAV4BCT5_9GAST|nr:protein jagged-2 [Plakobranchus ocellatus]